MADVSRKVVQELEAGRDGVTWRNLMGVFAVLNIKLRPEGSLIQEWDSEMENTLKEKSKGAE